METMTTPTYKFYSDFARILNAGQSRSIVLFGNIYDLFWNGTAYVPLVPFLLDKTKPASIIQVTYELNGPIRISNEDKDVLRKSWIKWKYNIVIDEIDLSSFKENVIDNRPLAKIQNLKGEFDKALLEVINSPTVALEFLRQLCLCSRTCGIGKNLLIIVEGADMLLPAGNGDVASLNEGQLHRIAIVQDWFSEPGFIAGKDSVCLVAESRSLIHPRVSKMPQIIGIEVASPNLENRQHYIDTFLVENKAENPWEGSGSLASSTAGLSLYALRQLLAGAVYSKEKLQAKDVIGKVEEYIKSQVGDDVVEFSRPAHSLKDVVGATKVKNFLLEELIPRLKAGGKQALSGCAVSGPIGSGKSFIFEAVASELDMPVLVIKNIRSQWFGQTDVIFERLRRALEALGKVCIFVDECDTVFGGLGANVHETERRLTGKIQAMMSDPKLKGKVVWILMTARIHLLSPDIRRPGRAGDLIIPILDPEGDDRMEFIKWAFDAYEPEANFALSFAKKFQQMIPQDYSAAAFASLRNHFAAHPMSRLNLSAENKGLVDEDITQLIDDLIPADIGSTRRYQKLQALMNCTRKSLLPDEFINHAEFNIFSIRQDWEKEIKALEAQGIN